MIRKLENQDIDAVMDIWLSSNIESHHFISKEYWEENFLMVKEILPKSDVYVFEELHEVKGFIGVMNGTYIAGIFVLNKYQGKGIGNLLLQYIKQRYPMLELHVYLKNRRAITFYLRQGFEIVETTEQEDTNEMEYLMRYKDVSVS